MWRTEFQNASGVWPDSVRPDASVIVPETITGQRRPVALEARVDRVERRLRVQRVEYGLDEQDVGAAFEQPLDRLAVSFGELVERHVARAGVVDVRRDRSGAVRRSERAGDEARLVGRARGPAVGAFARDRRSRAS